MWNTCKRHFLPLWNLILLSSYETMLVVSPLEVTMERKPLWHSSFYIYKRNLLVTKWRKYFQYWSIKGSECKEHRKASWSFTCFHHARPVEAIHCPQAECRELSAAIHTKNEGEQITLEAQQAAMEETENRLCSLNAWDPSEAQDINRLSLLWHSPLILPHDNFMPAYGDIYCTDFSL